MLFDPEKGEVLGSDYIPETDNNFKGKTLVDQSTEEMMYEIPFDRFSYIYLDFNHGGDYARDETNSFCVLSDEIRSEDRSTVWNGSIDFTIDKYTSDDGYILHIYKYYPDDFRAQFYNVSSELAEDYDVWLIHDEEIQTIAANDSDAEALVRYTKLAYKSAEDLNYVEEIHDLRTEINDEMKYIVVNGSDSYWNFDGFKMIWGNISDIVLEEEEGNHYIDSYKYEPKNLMDKYTLISRCQCSPHFRVTRASTDNEEFDGGNTPVEVIDYYQYTTEGVHVAKKYIKLVEEEFYMESQVSVDTYRNWAKLNYFTGFLYSTLAPSDGYSSRVLQLTPYTLNAIDKLNEKVDNIVEGIEETFIHFQEEIDDIMVDVTNTISNLYVSR